MARIRWSTRALQDFESALAYVAEENPQAARTMRERILATAGTLESFSLGLPGPNGCEKIYVPKTRYFIIFRRSSDGNVGIRALVHASRDWERINWDDM
jgi:toxin ParE1/3/4